MAIARIRCLLLSSASSAWTETVGGCVADAVVVVVVGCVVQVLARAIFAVCLARSVGGGLFCQFVRSVDEGVGCGKLARASLLVFLL